MSWGTDAQVRWITFHSGYDFGYLLKVLTCQALPTTEAEFFELLKVRRRWRAAARAPTSQCMIWKPLEAVICS